MEGSNEPRGGGPEVIEMLNQILEEICALRSVLEYNKGNVVQTTVSQQSAGSLASPTGASKESVKLVSEGTDEAAAGATAPQGLGTDTRLCVTLFGAQTDKSRGMVSSSSRFAPSATLLSADTHNDSQILRFWQLRHPASTWNLVLRATAVAFLLLDALVTPVVIAWSHTSPAITSVVIIGSCFWTVDMLCCFVQGYYDRGQLVFDLRKVVRRYCRNALPLDFLMVLTDWASVIFGSSEGGPNIRGGVALLRALRVCKVIVRLRRYAYVIEDFMEQQTVTVARPLCQLVKAMLGLLMIAHWLSCLWFLVGSSADADEPRWLNAFPHLTAVDEYWLSMNWAVAIITLGVPDAANANATERILTTTAFILGLITNTMLVSSLSAAVVEMNMNHAEKWGSVRTLNKYLHTHSVSRSIVQLVHQQVELRSKQSKHIDERDVPALVLLPTSLRNLLRHDICKASLLGHHFFRLMHSWHPAVCERRLMEAVTISHFCEGEEPFTAEVRAIGMHFVSSGQIVYTTEEQSGRSSSECFVDGGSWLSQQALWMNWHHVGSAKSKGLSMLILIEQEPFAVVMRSRKELADFAMCYAARASQVVNAAIIARNQCDDVQVSGMEWPSMALSFDTWRAAISDEAMSVHDGRMAHKLSLSRQMRSSALLRQEVDADRCLLGVTDQGSVLRLVELTAFRVQRPEDDRLLAEVGTYSRHGGGFLAAVRLPGAKQVLQLADSSDEEALQRVLEARFPSFLGHLEAMSSYTVVERKRSPEFGVMTEYRRRVIETSLRFDLPLQLCKVAPKVCPLDSTRSGISAPTKHALKDEVYWIVPNFEEDEVDSSDSSIGVLRFFAWLTEEQLQRAGAGGERQLWQEHLEQLEVPAVEDVLSMAGSAGVGSIDA